MKDIYQEALEQHKAWAGKLVVNVKAPLETPEDLSVAYTPGVAAPCLAIADDPGQVYTYTGVGNLVAVVSDGSAVLGLGDIGPAASLPVMEGKCALFKRFGGVDAVPIVVDTTDPEALIETVRRIAPSFGGINLEDIRAPKCVTVERALIESLSIPVFHDDQHGTAIVVTAALMNALRLVKKEPAACTAVVLGTGAAGSSIVKMLAAFGIGTMYAFHSRGILSRRTEGLHFLQQEIAEMTNPLCEDLSLEEAMARADVFIGVSAPNTVTPQMVASMKRDAVVFAMANPEPEIGYDAAKKAGARIVGTGRSDFPNQVNNVLAFPGLFRGALDARAVRITEEMKLAAAQGIAGLLTEEEVTEEYVIPSAFDPRVAQAVADAVREQAVRQGLARR